MRKKLFLFVTPEGITFSSPELTEPDVENFQVLGYGEGLNEDEAFKDFLTKNQWLEETKFEEAIAIEIKQKINEGKTFYLRRDEATFSERMEN